MNLYQLRYSKVQMLIDDGISIDSLKVFLAYEKIISTEIYVQASPKKVKKDLKAYDIFKNSQFKQE